MWGDVEKRVVSPAPAGIDLDGRHELLFRHSLPRTRGDRPGWAGLFPVKGESPPHPRGSTPARHSVSPSKMVSPAPAGIDPLEVLSARIVKGLPRTRGDRPSLLRAKPPHGQSPPHPRGSTRVESMQSSEIDVSPAPAGIDPARPYSRP